MANIDNISDELLAAYLEGNASADETMQVLDALQTDDILRETLDTALSIDSEEYTHEVLPMMPEHRKGKRTNGR